MGTNPNPLDPRMRPALQMVALAVSITLVASGCRSNKLPIDPAMASCVPPGTVAVAGIDLDKLRASPLYEAVPAEALREASYVLIAYSPKYVLVVGRGHFHSAPPGAVMADGGIALAGSANAVRDAIAQQKTGRTGAPELMARARTVPVESALWAVVAGNATLPLTGNAQNLNRALHFAQYTTLTAQVGQDVHLESTSDCASPQAAQRLEETLRAFDSLGATFSKGWQPIEIQRKESVVRATALIRGEVVRRLAGLQGAR